MTNQKPHQRERRSITKLNDQDALASLLVFNRLEVGPIRVEKRRIVAPYHLFWNGGHDTIDLIYRFEEDVFDPQEPASINMASLIAAQVAMNYGLFTKSLVFHGLLNETDRRFIRDMTENTSREIYVKKFLQSNPFLIGDASQLPAIRQKRYTQAKIHFPDNECIGG